MLSQCGRSAIAGDIDGLSRVERRPQTPDRLGNLPVPTVEITEGLTQFGRVL